MKYIQHSTGSLDDEKIATLIQKFGYEGYGLFWAVLEKIGKQEHPIKTDVLKHQLKVGKRLEKCWNFLEEIGLLSSNNGETFNENLLKFCGKFEIKSEKNKKRISEWREKQKDTKNVTRYEQKCNTPQLNKEVNKEEELNIIIPICADKPAPVLENPVEPEKKEPPKEVNFSAADTVPPPKRKKKPSAAPTTLHTRCRIFFESAAKVADKIVSWDGRCGRSLNELLAKIKTTYQEKNNSIPDEDQIFSGFELLITHLPIWDKENGFDINSINSGYNRITNKIKSNSGFNRADSKTDYDRVGQMFKQTRPKDTGS